MRSVTIKALQNAGYSEIKCPAVAALVEFVTQPSRIDPRDYYSEYRDKNGIAAYRTDCRRIAQLWQEFKKLLSECAALGVGDIAVVDASPRAFGGRLEWHMDKGRWVYTTGQYFCTEYRQAAVSVLDTAASAVRSSRPAAIRQVKTIKELKALNRENGGHWFEESTMGFFNSRIESTIIKGKYFITSEAYSDDGHDRRYTLRSFDERGNIDTVGEFNQAESIAAARKLIPDKRRGYHGNKNPLPV